MKKSHTPFPSSSADPKSRSSRDGCTVYKTLLAMYSDFMWSGPLKRATYRQSFSNYNNENAARPISGLLADGPGEPLDLRPLRSPSYRIAPSVMTNLDSWSHTAICFDLALKNQSEMKCKDYQAVEWRGQKRIWAQSWTQLFIAVYSRLR
jgi:hypothetical protein